MGNSFEQVDEPQPDAITLTLASTGEQATGRVSCPADLTPGQLVNDFEGDEMPAVEAFRAAIRLANEIKAPIVVHDPEGQWQEAWGTLYRDV